MPYVFTRDTFTRGKLTFLAIVLRYIFYCEMTFTSRKRVSCKHDICGVATLGSITILKHTDILASHLFIFHLLLGPGEIKRILFHSVGSSSYFMLYII